MSASVNSVEKISVVDVDDIDEEMPFELIQHAKEAILSLLPEQSRQKYNQTYKNFKEWQLRHGTPTISNQLVLAYFHTLAAEKKYKPTSLWAYHSMLKATIRTHEDVDIGKFGQVTAFLKSKSSGYRSTKARVFTEDNVKKFIEEADNLSWLDVKVVLIFGICGALRTDEFTRINLNDVEKHGQLFLVRINKTKTKIPRSFTISGGLAGIVEQFIDMRPVDLPPTDRFFTNYQRGKCYKQFIGKNKFSKMPQRIAEYLFLPEPERYTGHCFRRTSATILANSGADIETIMRHGGWRNEACAKVYIEDSVHYKARTGNMIQQSIFGNVSPSTSAVLIVPSTSAALVVPSTSAAIAVPPTEIPSSAQADGKDDFPATVSLIPDAFSDFEISDEQLVEIVDRASQSHQQSTNMSVNNGVGIHEIGNEIRTAIDEGSTDSGRLTQSTSNSSFKAILAKSFKPINFERMDNCTFNFNFAK